MSFDIARFLGCCSEKLINMKNWSESAHVSYVWSRTLLMESRNIMYDEVTAPSRQPLEWIISQIPLCHESQSIILLNADLKDDSASRWNSFIFKYHLTRSCAFRSLPFPDSLKLFTIPLIKKEKTGGEEEKGQHYSSTRTHSLCIDLQIVAGHSRCI